MVRAAWLLDLEIDRVDRSSGLSDDGVELTGQWKVESIDQVDRTSLKSSQSTFNTYELNEIGSAITHIKFYYGTTAVGASKMFWL